MVSPFVVWMILTPPLLSASRAVEGVGDGPELDLVEVRVRLVPVVRVLLGLERLVGLVVLEDERAGADWLRLQRRLVVGRGLQPRGRAM